ncbi:DNA-directed RNA polymerase subunit D [Thermoplasmatota archaeon]
MKIDVIDLKPKKILIKINGIEPYLVNSIRRILISELPKLAIDDVVIYDNTSALFDEIISHRLGLIPIPTDLSLLNFRDECVCKGKGCPSCTVRYTLSKENEGTVYSGDLQPAEESWAIKEDNIPIVELSKDQRLILEVEAILGLAKNHAKWQSVISPGYRFNPTIEIDKKRINEIQEFINNLPSDLVTLKNDKLEINDINKLPTLESYIDKEKIDFIKIKKDPNNIIFSFETDGSMDANTALLKSIEILKEKYNEFGNLLKKLK